MGEEWRTGSWDLKGVGRGRRPVAGAFRADVAWERGSRELQPEGGEQSAGVGTGLQGEPCSGPPVYPQKGPQLPSSSLGGPGTSDMLLQRGPGPPNIPRGKHPGPAHSLHSSHSSETDRAVPDTMGGGAPPHPAGTLLGPLPLAPRAPRTPTYGFSLCDWVEGGRSANTARPPQAQRLRSLFLSLGLDLQGA